MRRTINRTINRSLLLLSLAFFSMPGLLAAAPHQREHLTPEEVELVRDNQMLDARVAVFVKAVERRLLVLSGSQAVEKDSSKDSEKWGALPKGTRAQLISDVARIMEEAVTNIEDASIRSEKSSLIPKSLRKLAEASNRFLPQLNAMRETTQDEAERDLLEQAIESAQEVVNAAAKLPAESTDSKSKKKT